MLCLKVTTLISYRTSDNSIVFRLSVGTCSVCYLGVFVGMFVCLFLHSPIPNLDYFECNCFSGLNTNRKNVYYTVP